MLVVLLPGGSERHSVISVELQRHRYARRVAILSEPATERVAGALRWQELLERALRVIEKVAEWAVRAEVALHAAGQLIEWVLLGQHLREGGLQVLVEIVRVQAGRKLVGKVDKRIAARPGYVVQRCGVRVTRGPSRCRMVRCKGCVLWWDTVWILYQTLRMTVLLVADVPHDGGCVLRIDDPRIQDGVVRGVQIDVVLLLKGRNDCRVVRARLLIVRREVAVLRSAGRHRCRKGGHATKLVMITEPSGCMYPYEPRTVPFFSFSSSRNCTLLLCGSSTSYPNAYVPGPLGECWAAGFGSRAPLHRDDWRYLVHVVAQDRSVGVVGNRGGDDLLDGRGGLVDDGVESVVVIGGVVDGAHRAVGFDQRVLSLDDVTVALLSLRLDVSGMRVLDAVVERVFRVGLGHTIAKKSTNSAHQLVSSSFNTTTIERSRDAQGTNTELPEHTYHRLGDDVLQDRGGVNQRSGVDQSGTIVAVFDRRRTDGDGEQSNGNEALQGAEK
uniref:Uncharacterized protein n=1 Tax=Anopheles atroparvus TaxID=41427 RepID=A0A182IQL9_ANOAO